MALSIMQRHDEARVEMERALALDPFSPYVNGNYGRLLYFAGKHHEAVAHMERALEFDPGFAFTRSRMGLAYEGAGDYDRAIREFRRAHELSGKGPLAAASLGYALGMSGARAEATALLEELVALAATRYVSAASIADVHLGLGDYDRALDALERAVEERANAIGAINVNPRYRPLRGNPRFERLVQQVWPAERVPGQT